MSTSGFSSGDITEAELNDLAHLFDRSEFALDPLSSESKESKLQFEGKVRTLFLERIQGKYSSISFNLFRLRMRTACRVYLRKNEPCFPQDLPSNQNLPP